VNPHLKKRKKASKVGKNKRKQVEKEIKKHIPSVMILSAIEIRNTSLYQSISLITFGEVGSELLSDEERREGEEEVVDFDSDEDEVARAI
jgi:hypothetical protein